ncbi:hypothetical protein [Candidatus Magnetobacterium casense]|uniref:Uncharacterized protein n=1 Tax=Candidatus Magnetobacterium casense TaxID=1455061 RepID=A0ABS6S0J2_9BACT|nr:hypothetical protein [Candidatus Magnetobacterium casensis]MBV6342375.1 hypothetical protein [Candidatus Magnetobacterium casensis]
MKKPDLALIIGVVTLIGACFGAFFFFEARYAQCEEVKKLERRLDYKIENDQLMGMQQRVWQLEERYPKPETSPPAVQQRMKELNASIEMQKEKVKKLEHR